MWFVVSLMINGGGSSELAHDILQIADHYQHPDHAAGEPVVMHRLTPPNFVEERLNRRQKEDTSEEGGNNRLSGDTGEEDEEEKNINDKELKYFHLIQYVSPNGQVLEKPEGTGPTNLGFVMDFVHERGHPKFRAAEKAQEARQAMENSQHNHITALASALNMESQTSSIKACEYLEEPATKTTGDEEEKEDDATTTTTQHIILPRLLQHKVCQDGSKTTMVYNAASFPRYVCGGSTMVPPNSAIKLDCGDKGPVRLLPKDIPPVSSSGGDGMPPIVIHGQADGTVPDSLETVSDCAISCQMEKDLTGMTRYVQGTDWKIYHSTQDPGSRREIQTELSKFKHDEYFSTAYFKSDIPLSAIDLSKHNIRDRPALSFDTVLDKGVYLLNSDCQGGSSRRQRWMEVVSNAYHVDSFGKCQHNKDLQAGESIDTLEGRLEIMKKYKFNLGFEISTHKDWLTELSYEAMLSGAVPIILGASNAKNHFPRNSAIFASDFNSWDKLATHVKEVATDKTLWESFHTWRTDETALAAFERKYQFTKTSPECRMCSWAYAKMYGLGWDHELQRVQPTYIPREMCIDGQTNLVTKPFREVWTVGSSSSLKPAEDSQSSCQKAASSDGDQTLKQDGWSVVRSIVQHSSVTDIMIHDIQSGDEEMTLAFEFKNVNNTEGAFFRNSHSILESERGVLVSSGTIQDHKSKVTVLANWETKVWSPRQGIIQLVIQSKNAPALHEDEMRRIRLITEDMGQLHDKMTEYFPSSFAKRAIQDFVDPLEVFYLDS